MKDYYLGPVEGVYVYDRDVVVKRGGLPVNNHGTQRGGIREISHKSRIRLAFVAANTQVDFVTFTTLTYPAEFPTEYKRIKRDLECFLDWQRRDQACPRYLWWFEFQRRGAPHYHIVTDRPIHNTRRVYKEMRFRVAAAWYRIVGSHDAKHLAAGTSVERVRKRDGGHRYALKYAMKMRQRHVPDGWEGVGRWFGYSAGVVPEQPPLVACTEDDVRGTLEGWKYAPSEDRDLYRVLYGAAPLFRAHLPPMSDNIETFK